MIINYDVSYIFDLITGKMPDDQVHNISDIVSRVANVGDYIPIVVGTDSAVTYELCGTNSSGVAVFKGVSTRIDYICCSSSQGYFTFGTIDKTSNAVVVNGFDNILLENKSTIYDNANTLHLHTPIRANGSYAQFTLEPDGKITVRTTTDDGATWTGWKTIADTIEPTKVTLFNSSSTLSVAAGSVNNISIPCSSSGYTPLGILGITKIGTNSSYCIPYEFFVDNSENAKVYLRNIGTGDASITIGVYVLLKKS